MSDLHKLLGDLRQFVDTVAGENRPSREWAIELRGKIDAIPERVLAERAGGVKVKALLNEIASWTQTKGLLWWQTKAREALSYFPHEFQQNGPGIVGSDICTICGKERDGHDEISALTTEPAAPSRSDRLRECYLSGQITERQWQAHVDAGEVEPAAPEGRQEAVALPPYGKMPFDELGRDVSEAATGVRRDFEFGETYPGHVMTGINFNSLNRIVSKYVTRPSEQAVTDEWREIKQHVQPRIADGYTAVAISKPGYWFVKGPGPAAAAIRALGRKA